MTDAPERETLAKLLRRACGFINIAERDGMTLCNDLSQAADALERPSPRAPSGSPAEVPPNKDTKRLDWLERAVRQGDDIALGAEADDRVLLQVGQITEMAAVRQSNLESLDGHSLREAIDAAMKSAAVWRSAQQ